MAEEVKVDEVKQTAKKTSGTKTKREISFR